MDESSVTTRTDSIVSGSVLRLADVLCQNILLHPFVALRRTCQVNRRCSPFICVQPFSLLPFIYHQQRKQGLTALYKGLSSELLVKGMTLGTETAIANYADWPTEIRPKRRLEDSIRLLTLRAISVALSTPFFCSAVIETVQSVIVVSDRPSFLDCITDGFARLLHFTSSPATRIMPIWLLVLPTVFYHVAHSAIWHVSHKAVHFCKRNMLTRSTRRTKTRRSHRSNHQVSITRSMVADESTAWSPHNLTSINQTQGEASVSVDSIEVDNNQISSSIMASLIADVALLPVETVLNSLYIQGTRTIIDNCDETTVVLPVLTNYDGFVDCYQSILRFEGNLGLYKGLGAIVLQYSVHFLIFRSLYYLLREIQSSGSRATSVFPSSPTRQQKQQSKRATAINEEEIEFKHSLIGGNRHSTPNNPTESLNRFDESLYSGFDENPNNYDRLWNKID